MNPHSKKPTTERTLSSDTRREAWIDRAIALLDESAGNLDGATLSRLNRARHAALAAHPLASARSRWLLGGSLAGATLALMIAVGVSHRLSPSIPSALPDGTAQDDLDAVISDDNPELYENLDFYAWLDAQQQDGNG